MVDVMVDITFHILVDFLRILVDIIVNTYTFAQKPSLIIICSFPRTKAVFLHYINTKCFLVKKLP